MPDASVPVTPGYRVTDRRGVDSMRWSNYGGRSDTLFRGSVQTSDRKNISFLDKDTHRNITNTGRRTLMTLGKYLYANFPSLAGAVNEQAILSTENLQPQFYGADKEWGAQAEEMLIEWGRIADIAGGCYDFATWLEMLVVSDLREGDLATILTQTEEGYPQIQMIPGGRIGGSTQADYVVGGPYDGARMIDGVIVNDYRRPIAYRVYDESGTNSVDVPASAVMLTFTPQWPDQVRGFSALASAVFDWQDIRESRDFELIAQKAASAIALIEENELGQATAKDSIFGNAATFDSDGNKSTPQYQKMDGGLYKYFKAGTNSKLSAFAYDRPGTSTQQYQETIIRDAFAGLDWNMFFSLDPSKVGGASMRVVVEKINRTIRKRQRMVIRSARRVHGYVIAKLMKLKLLPANDEWFQWEYQLPAEVTADKRYDSDVDIAELNMQMTTMSRVCAKRGEYWEDVQDQWLDERKRLIDRAKEKGVDLTTISVPEITAQVVNPKTAQEQEIEQQRADNEVQQQQQQGEQQK